MICILIRKILMDVLKLLVCEVLCCTFIKSNDEQKKNLVSCLITLIDNTFNKAYINETNGF